ncbi:hypothetical protein Goklo_019770 [Gossypium klotzschianum]|uniref:Uncharacterized protein n=1 Tax=Gossypium klotzschianum TaxID=34286 RepID=A0A7J8UQI2_9ROSI|nr:hypothetical protein [Gossypium klotzschianum]
MERSKVMRMLMIVLGLALVLLMADATR